jgi:hypothetical protein
MGDKVVDTKEIVASVDVDEVNMDALIPYYSCCCFINSLYTDTVNCWGCSTGGQLLCFDCDFVGLKRSKEPGKICNILSGHLDCIVPKSCCQFTSQILCLDSRAALPCTDEVPCMINFFGLTLAYKKKFIPGCCMKVGVMNKKFDAKASSGAAPQLEMTR